MNTQATTQSKSILAKLLATENIIVQHKKKISTAFFDVKSRILVLPMWDHLDESLYNMLVVHEVGHALETPGDGWVDAIKKIAQEVGGGRHQGAVQAFLNVVEDARIDKLQKRRYPGSKRYYFEGYRTLLTEGFFGDVYKSREFIDRINIHFKAGLYTNVAFNAAEMKFITEIEKLETWNQVVDLTKRLYVFCQKQKSKKPSGYTMIFDDSDEEILVLPKSSKKNQTPISPPKVDVEDDKSTFTTGTGEISGQASSDSDDEIEEEDDFDINDHGEETSNFDDDENYHEFEEEEEEEDLSDVVLSSDTLDSWNESQKKLVLSTAPENTYLSLDYDFDTDVIVDGYKKCLSEWPIALDDRLALPLQRNSSREAINEWKSIRLNGLNKFKKDESRALSFMVKEFEMRKAASEYKRTSISKTGSIHTKKLHSYKFNDDIFKRIEHVSEGKNHGFVIFLDWSGSMADSLNATMKQLFSLTMFCTKVNIPFEVYTFTTGRDEYLESKEDVINFGSPRIRNILSSKMTKAEMNEAMFHLWNMSLETRYSTDNMGGTPLLGALLIAPKLVRKFQLESKVEILSTIFITDGDGDSNFQYKRDGYSYEGTFYRIQSPLTKTTYDWGKYISQPFSSYNPGVGNSVDRMKNILLKELKTLTGTNVIGFFITGDFGTAKRSSHKYIQPNLENSKDRASFQSDGFYETRKSSGYDSFFVMNTTFFRKIDEKKTNKIATQGLRNSSIAKKFTENFEMKKKSRVFLKNFITRISA